MKKMLGTLVVALSLLGQEASASVTPAHLAMRQVQQFLNELVEAKVQEVIPPHKPANHVIQFQTNLMRGKYSEGEGHFSDFFGNTSVMLQIGNSDTYYEVNCSQSATAVVVPFAMQLVPVLEEEVNQEQLILKRHNVSCRLQ